jgi:hypothetical protein
MTHGSEHFTVSVTAERLSAAVPVLIEAGSFWSRRIVRRWNAPGPINRFMYWVLIVCAWGIAGLSPLVALALRSRESFLYLAYGVGGLTAAVFLHKVGFERFNSFPIRLNMALNARTSGGIFGWKIRRLFAAVIKKAPLTIQYEISAEGIRSTCRELDTHRFLRADRIDFVHLTSDLLVVFVRENIRKGFFPVYLEDDKLRAAVQKFLATNQITPIKPTDA